MATLLRLIPCRPPSVGLESRRFLGLLLFIIIVPVLGSLLPETLISTSVPVVGGTSTTNSHHMAE